MKTIILFFLSTILFTGAAKGGDLDLLQGAWNEISPNHDGEKPETSNPKSRFVIKKNSYTITSNSYFKGNIKLFSIDGAKIFEQSFEVEGQAKSIHPGIFRLNGDTFQQGTVSGKTTVPEDFLSFKGDRRSFQVWKRVGQVPADLTNENDALVGTWRLDSFTFDGKRTDEEITKGSSLSTLVVRPGGGYSLQIETVTKGTLRLDEAKNPKQINFVSSSPESTKGTVLLGIYKFDGNRLTVDRTFNTTQTRPTEFESTSKKLHFIYERGDP